jgi:23S rRNA (adenine2030-N6)-methyltransferase
VNYRHAFHAGNHADVFKHLILLGLLAALKRKDSAFFALDTHAGRGSYSLDSAAARKTQEAEAGISRLLKAGLRGNPLISTYLAAVRAVQAGSTPTTYPGSPLLIANALREQDRLACCELQPDEAGALKALLAGNPRVGVHERDGYAALAALLPPKEKRGLVLIDPPYEAQLAEFDQIMPALRAGLARWPTGMFALWYPIKRRRSLQPFYRRAADLPAQQVLAAELLVRPDDSPLRMNGSGMLIVNPPWKFNDELATALPALSTVLDEGGGSWQLDWLKSEQK